MQEARGSSPLSSTPTQRPNIEYLADNYDPVEGHFEGQALSAPSGRLAGQGNPLMAIVNCPADRFTGAQEVMSLSG
jgi:hypothetical protein